MVALIIKIAIVVSTIAETVKWIKERADTHQDDSPKK